MNRADAPVAKLDFVNLVASFGGAVSTDEAQPVNHAMVGQGPLRLGDAVMVSSRALVDEALRNPAIYSSEDLVEQGNTLPLIPLNIDPPDHPATVNHRNRACLFRHNNRDGIAYF